MSYELIIGNKNYSSWSLRPWVWMRHHAIEFSETSIALGRPDTAANIAVYQSGGTVPVLRDGDQQVWESLAILEHLAEAHPEKSGWPADPAARSMARCVSAEMPAGFAALRSELPMNCRLQLQRYELSAAVQSDVARIDALWLACRERFGQTGPWLFGRFSIADAMFAPVVFRFRSYAVDVSAGALSYMRTVLADSAVQAWAEAAALEPDVIESVEMTR